MQIRHLADPENKYGQDIQGSLSQYCRWYSGDRDSSYVAVILPGWGSSENWTASILGMRGIELGGQLGFTFISSS